MIFNGDKFELVRFWPGSEKPPNTYLDPQGLPIQEKNDLRDLGVQISGNLSFKVHIESVVASATRSLGWFCRTFRRRSQNLMMTGWKSLIQCKLDYCSQLWSPTDQASIASLERVARSFTSKISGMENLDYWDRLQALNMLSQQRRRERYQIIFIWKISQGLIQGYSLPFKENARRGLFVEIPSLEKQCPAAVTNAIEASLKVRGARLFNLMPQYLRDMKDVSVDTFKANLDTWLASIPDQPTIPGRQRAAQSNSLIDQAAMLVASTSNS